MFVLCEDAGHFPRAGPLPGFGNQRNGVEVVFFFHGNEIQIGTLCLVPLSCRAWLEHGLYQPDLAFGGLLTLGLAKLSP